MNHFSKMLIVGCGNMGGAMLAGWIAAGIKPSRFAILDPGLESAPEGVELFKNGADVCGHDCVLLGFKPQQLPSLCEDLQPLIGDEETIFSLLAGIELASLKRAFPGAKSHVRVMPNLAARINKSPVILAQLGMSDPDERRAAQELFGALGDAHWLENENQFDLVTALAGSGPGFVYRFIDALAGAAADLGLDENMAQSLAVRMVEGASALAASSQHSPAQLADRVASPGGMTREGLNVLDSDKALQGLLTMALAKTAQKGGELAALAAKDG